MLIFEKDSTRTRSGFEVAAYDQGAHVTYIGPSGSHMGSTETVKDTARVFGRMYDGIEFRGFTQAEAEELANYSGVPVWNGLTNEVHPTQVLADFLTMQEEGRKPLSAISCCFLGDVGCNMADSLMIGAAKMGMDMRLGGPRQTWPDNVRLVTGATFAIFTEPYLLTSGGPQNATLTWQLEIYYQAFEQFRASYGATVALLNAVVTLLTIMIIRRLLKVWGRRSGTK